MSADRPPSLFRLGAIHALLEVHFWFPIWVVFLLDRGISLGWIVAADVWFRLVLVALELPLGVVGDRIGRKRTYLLGALIAVATYLLLAVTHGVPMLFLCWTLWAVTIALISGTDTAYQYEAITGRGQRGAAVTMFGRLRAAGATALLLSYLTAGLLYERAPALPILLNAVAALGAALLLIRARSVPQGPQHLHWSATLKELIARVRLQRDVRFAVFLLAAIGVYYWTVTLLIQPLLVELDFAPGAFGPVYGAFCLSGIVASLLSGRLARALGEGTLIVGGSALLVVGMVILAFVPGPACLVGLALLGCGFFLAEPVSKVLLNGLVPDRIRASAISLASLIASVALMAARPLVGVITDLQGARQAFVVWAALGVAFLALAAWAVAAIRRA
ncbi:MAG: MFS transporter [Planctomycetota bacterium]|jgi:MFS family permease